MGMQQVWKEIWAVNAMPKMLSLVQRAANNSLPTKSRLRDRHTITNDCCPVCNRAVETPIHALWECTFASKCWRISRLRWDSVNVDFVFDWLTDVLKQIRQEKKGGLVAICWGI